VIKKRKYYVIRVRVRQHFNSPMALHLAYEFFYPHTSAVELVCIAVFTSIDLIDIRHNIPILLRDRLWDHEYHASVVCSRVLNLGSDSTEERYLEANQRDKG
jgi:hypothetical protein